MKEFEDHGFITLDNRTIYKRSMRTCDAVHANEVKATDIKSAFLQRKQLNCGVGRKLLRERTKSQRDLFRNLCVNYTTSRTGKGK